MWDRGWGQKECVAGWPDFGYAWGGPVGWCQAQRSFSVREAIQTAFHPARVSGNVVSAVKLKYGANSMGEFGKSYEVTVLFAFESWRFYPGTWRNFPGNWRNFPGHWRNFSEDFFVRLEHHWPLAISGSSCCVICQARVWARPLLFTAVKCFGTPTCPWSPTQNFRKCKRNGESWQLPV